MKKLNEINDWVYDRIKWIMTPLFLWVIITRSFGWLDFEWWNGAFVFGYVFLYRKIENK